MSGFPPPRKSDPHGQGPYRESVLPASTPARIPCPFCSFEIDPSASRCPRCQVELDPARCPGCNALGTLGERTCVKCGADLPRLVSGEANDAPCPRCDGTLAPIADEDGCHQCRKCNGVFLGHEAYANAVRRHAAGNPLPAALLEHVEPPPDEVVYLKCPCCAARMHRRRLGRPVEGLRAQRSPRPALGRSIVVDVCKMHGTWFDRGEVARVLTQNVHSDPDPAPPTKPLLAPEAKEAIARAQVETAIETVRVERQASFIRSLLSALFGIPPV